MVWKVPYRSNDWHTCGTYVLSSLQVWGWQDAARAWQYQWDTRCAVILLMLHVVAYKYLKSDTCFLVAAGQIILLMR